MRGQIAVGLLFVLGIAFCTVASEQSVFLKNPVGSEGHIFCRIQTPEAYQSGRNNKSFRKSLLELPGVGDLQLGLTQQAVSIEWVSKTGGKTPTTEFLLPELPAGEYAVQISWDAGKGILNAYLNDMPLREPDTAFQPWSVSGSSSEALISESDVRVFDVEVKNRFCPEKEALALVPEKLKRFPSLACKAVPLHITKGALIYQTPMSAPDNLSGWIMEGPGETEFENGWMRMLSSQNNAGEEAKGHIVYWCPQNFPDRFVAEWDVVHESDYGLLIVFFATIGPHGEDIFDPSLPKRDGKFSHYTKGEINSYHISYFGNSPFNAGRPNSNLRKNPPSLLCTQAPVLICPDDKHVAHIQLIKDKSHIQMLKDGVVYLDFIDDNPDRFGLPYREGKVGFRQMQWSVAKYRNFSVWSLE